MNTLNHCLKSARQNTVIIYNLILIVSCSFIMCGSLDAKEEVDFSTELNANFKQPVDIHVSEDGDIIVLDKDLSRIIVFDGTGEVNLSFGVKGSEDGQLYKPESLALSHQGEIIVADTGNSRVLVYEPNGEFRYQIGNFGTNQGEFKRPNCLAVSPSGYIYVADSVNKTLSTFTPKGVFLEDLSLNQGADDMLFDRQGNLYVLFSKDGKIVKYGPNMMVTDEITLIKQDRDYIKSTSHMAVDHRGDIYLVEMQDHRIMKVTQDQNIVLVFGSKGVGRGQFNQPSGIVTDQQDRIYVTDSRNKRVQVFEITGAVKDPLPSVMVQPAPLEYDSSLFTGQTIVDLDYVPDAGLYALSDYNGNILFMGDNRYVLGKSEENKLDLKNPKALHVLPDGRIIVTDTGNHRLQFLSPDGTNEYHFGVKGKNLSQFNALQGIAVDQEGYLYVADTKNHRIQIFNKDGIYLRSFGKISQNADGNGAKPGTFLNPMDLDFDSRDRLYVLDYENKRIQVFDKQGQFLKEIGGVLDDIQFSDPVDLAIDEKNYLYIADRGTHSVVILNPEGRMVMRFGSNGKGPSYFPQLSAISSSSGKIYVSDYLVDNVRVYKFLPAVSSKDDYLFLTKKSPALNMDQATDAIRQAMARKLTLEDIKKEFINELGVLEQDFDREMKIESEQALEQGQLKLTVKIPRSIVPQGYNVLGMK